MTLCSLYDDLQTEQIFSSYKVFGYESGDSKPPKISTVKLRLHKTISGYFGAKESTQQLLSNCLSYQKATALDIRGISGFAPSPLVQVVTLLRAFVIIHEQDFPYCTVMTQGEAKSSLCLCNLNRTHGDH